MAAGAEVLVLGLGVSGLSCGVRLLEAGFSVRALGAEPPLATTSAVAAALWYPYKVGPPERVARWAKASLAEFGRLATGSSRVAAATGVAWLEGLEILAGAASPSGWHAVVPGLRPARPDELPAARRHGLVFRVPLIEMPLYLPWLLQRFESLGGRVDGAHIDDLDAIAASERLTINCTGLGARELCADAALYPIRGQTVRIEAGIVQRFVVDDSGGAEFAFLVPRSGDAILGGTAHEGRSDLAPVQAESDAIVARCAEYEPGVRLAARLETRVGLRPGRKEVRLDLERRPNGALVIHDYGHGGAGVTLSWGCADEVSRLARKALQTTGGIR